MKRLLWRPKLFTCIKSYKRQQFMRDLIAGALVAVIAFPLSVALAISSGMSPERGLYSAIIGGFFVSLLGGSKVNIGGATAATVMTVFMIVEEFGLTGLAIASIMAGLFLIGMGLLKLGALLKYIPKTITLGFTAGIAMGIFSGQLKGFFGLEMGAVPVKVIDKFIAYAAVVHTIDMASCLIGLLTMGILIGLPRLTAKIPNSLAAILITTPLAAITGINVPTIRTVYGELPSHFPTFTVPAVTWELVENLIPAAMTLAILIAIVSLLSCVVTDGLLLDVCGEGDLEPKEEPHDSNQELIAQGIANIFCGFFGAVPVAGAVARASNSIKYGGRTPMAGIVHSAVVLLILLFAMPLAGYIPIPTLAAILILVAYNMSNWREFVYIAKYAPKSDFFVLMGTFIAGILVDLLFAVQIGVLLTALLFLRRMTEVTHIRAWDYGVEQRPVPRGTLVYEINGPVIFATADELMQITGGNDTKVIILRMNSVPTVDFTALRNLEKFLITCQKRQIKLIFSHVNAHPYAIMKKARFIELAGPEYFCANIDEALILAENIAYHQEPLP